MTSNLAADVWLASEQTESDLASASRALARGWVEPKQTLRNFAQLAFVAGHDARSTVQASDGFTRAGFSYRNALLDFERSPTLENDGRLRFAERALRSAAENLHDP